MITTVLFDMGGTLEDIWVDEESFIRSMNCVVYTFILLRTSLPLFGS